MNCLLCGSSKTKKALSKYDRRIEKRLDVYRCGDCLVAFSSEPPGVELYDYYFNRIKKEKDELYCPVNGSRFESLLLYFEHVAPGKKLLDVGCGEGQFLDVAIRMGWDAQGVDIADGALAICERFGLPAKKHDFHLDGMSEGEYSVVSMIELLEHSHDPLGIIENAGRALRAGGILYLTTPNYDSLERRVFRSRCGFIHCEHMFYFSESSLRWLVEKSSRFRVEWIRSRNFVPNVSQGFRKAVERSSVLRSLKSAANSMLNAVNFGTNLQMVCRRVAD